MTALQGVDRNIDELAALFRTSGTPSFSMLGSYNVERGLLMSISSDSGYDGLGEYSAKKFVAMLKGRKPSSLPMVYKDPLKTAEEIGFSIPESIRKIAQEVYRE